MGLFSSIPGLLSLMFAKHTQSYSNPPSASKDTACDYLISADREFVHALTNQTLEQQSVRRSLLHSHLGHSRAGFLASVGTARKLHCRKAKRHSEAPKNPSYFSFFFSRVAKHVVFPCCFCQDWKLVTEMSSQHPYHWGNTSHQLDPEKYQYLLMIDEKFRPLC